MDSFSIMVVCLLWAGEVDGTVLVDGVILNKYVNDVVVIVGTKVMFDFGSQIVKVTYFILGMD